MRLNKELILASKSPRRSELLKYITPSFKVIPSNINEICGLEIPEEIVKTLALQKAKRVLEENKETIVLGFDTLVVCDNQVLGKPQTKQEAFDMIKCVQGKSHRVITGCAVVSSEEEIVFYDDAIVTFTNMSIAEIEDYIATKEPFGKAGSYAIQGHAAKFISNIEGDYYSVVGIPLHKLYTVLKRLS